MILTAPFANLNILSNATAQGYSENNYEDTKYSKYPTEDKKYECKTGPFEGFFVSSVEFCKHAKFVDKDDDRRDHRDNNILGAQGSPGPQGLPGTQGLPGLNGTNGINGINGVNGTNIDPCVACLLDALVKLDSGAVLVNVTADLERGLPGPRGDVNVTLPLVIDVDVALLLQQQLAVDLGLDANATIFEICAAIDAQQQSLDVAAIITSLELDLDPIVTAQISQLVNQIAIAISDITGEPIDQALIDEILASVDIDAIVAQITANVQVSLEILETCIGQEPPPLTTETLTVIKNVDCQADAQTCEQNPIQSSNFTVVIEDNNPSQNNFPGSSGTGTNVELEAGPYNVTEQGLDPVTPAICSTMGYEAGSTLDEDLFICTNFSDECEGNITIGNPQTCTIENALVSTPTETLTVIKNVDCQADAQTCEQNPIQPSNFTIVIDGNNPSQNNFPGSSGTGTDVELEPGAYNVTEQGLDPVTPAICSTMGFEAGQVVSPDTRGLFICTNFSDGCEGDITIGNPQTCTIENVLVKLNFLDLAVANQNSNSVSILLGAGNGTFGTPAVNFGVGTRPVSVALGDFNNDTIQDLAVANFNSDNVSILLGIGNGTFVTPAVNFGVGTEPISVAVGDFNGDTILDLAVANGGSNNVSILLGIGNGTFVTPAVNYGVGEIARSVAVGDFNNDTIQDLAVANLGSFADEGPDSVSILLGAGNGTFDTATNFGVGDRPTSVAIGDFNNDTIQDLAVTNYRSNSVSILLGAGNGTFVTPAVNFGVGTGPLSVALGDFNNDTIQDLAVANINSENVSILLGIGNGTFVTPAVNYGVGAATSVAVADFNNDTIQDLAVANAFSANVSILLGNGNGTFVTPAVNYGVGRLPESIVVGDFN